MKIDKNVGRWCEKFSDELDDIAYQLYINDFSQHFGDSIDNSIYEKQEHFIKCYLKYSNKGDYLPDYYQECYEKANLLLRFEKIEKLKNEINTKRF